MIVYYEFICIFILYWLLDTFSVYIIHTEKSKDLGLSGRYLLRIKENAFELLDPDTYSIVKVWPVKYARK